MNHKPNPNPNPMHTTNRPVGNAVSMLAYGTTVLNNPTIPTKPKPEYMVGLTIILYGNYKSIYMVRKSSTAILPHVSQSKAM